MLFVVELHNSSHLQCVASTDLVVSSCLLKKKNTVGIGLQAFSSDGSPDDLLLPSLSRSNIDERRISSADKECPKLRPPEAGRMRLNGRLYASIAKYACREVGKEDDTYCYLATQFSDKVLEML